MSTTKAKTEYKWAFIKIVHDEMMAKYFTQSWHNFTKGDIIKALVLTKEQRKKIRDGGHHDPGAGYFVPKGAIFLSDAMVSTNISQKEYDKYLKKLGKEIAQKEEELVKMKAQIDGLKATYVEAETQKVLSKDK